MTEADWDEYDDDDEEFCYYCGGPLKDCYCDDCPTCHGTGLIFPEGYYEGDGSKTCPDCNGEGQI